MNRKASARVAEVNIYIGNSIRQRRSEMSIDTIEFAALIGMTPAQLNKYEKGITRFDATVLHRMASILEIDMNSFFDGLSSR